MSHTHERNIDMAKGDCPSGCYDHWRPSTAEGDAGELNVYKTIKVVSARVRCSGIEGLERNVHFIQKRKY